MQIIKKGKPVSDEELKRVSDLFKHEVTCEFCQTIFKPEITDYLLSTKLNNNIDGNMIFSLEGKVNCPICRKVYEFSVQNLNENTCFVLRNILK